MSLATGRIIRFCIGGLLALGLLVSPALAGGHMLGTALAMPASPCVGGGPGGGAVVEPYPINWAQFGFDSANTRCNPYETRLSPSSVPNLHLRWSFTSAPFGQTPVVVNGIVYVPSGYPDNNLYAVSASTGAVLWAAPIPTIPSTSPTAPAVFGGVVYVSVNDSLYTFNATNGTPGWSFTTGSWLQTAPAIANGTVYVASQDSTLYAIDAATGALRWQAPIAGSYVPGPVSIANGAVYVAAGESLEAFNATTGALIWSIPFPVSGSAPVYANGLLYIGGAEDVYAINATNGAQVWVRPTRNSVNGTVALDHDTAYIGSGDGYVYAYDAQTGRLKWAFGTNRLDNIFTSAAVANGVVYITSARNIGYDAANHIFAYSAATGKLLWKYAPGYPVYASPIVVNGTLYVSTYVGLDAFTV